MRLWSQTISMNFPPSLSIARWSVNDSVASSNKSPFESDAPYPCLSLSLSLKPRLFLVSSRFCFFKSIWRSASIFYSTSSIKARATSTFTHLPVVNHSSHIRWEMAPSWLLSSFVPRIKLVFPLLRRWTRISANTNWENEVKCCVQSSSRWSYWSRCRHRRTILRRHIF